MPQAAYRWYRLIATARANSAWPQAPAKRWVAPSSAATNASALRRCSSVMVTGAAADADDGAPGSATGLRRSVRHFKVMPCSAKYLIAPGWYGIGEAPWVCHLRSKFSASLCTSTSSGFLSKMVFTML